MYFVTLVLAVSCSQSAEPAKVEDEHIKTQYQCPMKCTEEKFDKAGQCPVCKMDLEEISES
jgi:transcription initiation factor IIE alpha subunit